jgi:hypothetical protein
MAKKSQKVLLPEIKCRCEACNAPLTFELHVTGFLAGGTYCTIGDNPYGQFSFVAKCFYCDTRQRMTIKFAGEKDYSIVGTAAQEFFDELRKKTCPQANRGRAKWQIVREIYLDGTKPK